MIRRRLTTKQREALWQSERDKTRAAGLGDFPICALCSFPILPGRQWDENHQGHKPRWLGGIVDGISHRRCNNLNAATYATPLFAKSERVRKGFLDLKRSRSPLPGGRDDSRKKTMRGEVVLRSTGERP